MSRVTTWAVLLTGAPAVGKSSVPEELATLLEIEGVEFGALESEQLGWGSPWLSPGAGLGRRWTHPVRNLCSQARRYQCAELEFHTRKAETKAAERDAVWACAPAAAFALAGAR